MPKSDALSFGVVGLAAALVRTPGEVRALVSAGVIKPEFVEAKAPRWSVLALADIVKELLPVRQGDLLATRQRVVVGVPALERAYQAEYGSQKGGANG